MSTLDKIADAGAKGAAAPAKAVTPSTALKTGLFDDVEVAVTVHLGDAVLTIAQICALEAGSVVHLDLKLSEPATLYLKDRPIARGEIVAVDDRFALRISDILPVRDA